MGIIVNIQIGRCGNTSQIRFGTNYLVETVGGVYYKILDDPGSAKLAYTKSTDGGYSWSLPILILNDTITYMACWYDRWSGIAAGLIHIAYINSTSNNVLYRSIDTENSDTLSTEYTIFDGASTAANGSLSITRTRGGNLICGGCIDGGTEMFCYKSTDVGGTWSSIAAVSEANVDQTILLPGWATDNQDAMAFFWDYDANEISRKLYDDSANSWAETSIATSMTLSTAATTYPHFAAAVDITNSQNLLVAWSNVDTFNADLRCWKVTEGSITELTNVVLNSTDDQGLCAIGINTTSNDLYVFYGGKSNGSETWSTSVNIYMKVSKDGGTTWGAETKLSNRLMGIKNLFCSMMFNLKYGCCFLSADSMYGATYNNMNIIKEVYTPKTYGGL